VRRDRRPPSARAQVHGADWTVSTLLRTPAMLIGANLLFLLGAAPIVTWNASARALYAFWSAERRHQARPFQSFVDAYRTELIPRLAIGMIALACAAGSLGLVRLFAHTAVSFLVTTVVATGVIGLALAVGLASITESVHGQRPLEALARAWDRLYTTLGATSGAVAILAVSAFVALGSPLYLLLVSVSLPVAAYARWTAPRATTTLTRGRSPMTIERSLT
jgi:hypothetical protein